MLSKKSVQIFKYAPQKSVKVRCVVQKILSKFYPLAIITMQYVVQQLCKKIRKTANIVFFKGYQYQDLLKLAKYATKYESVYGK